MAMDQISGYLSRRAQGYWAGSVVMFSQVEQVWYLERPTKKPVGLGATDAEAHQGLMALIQAERQAKKAGLPAVEV